MNGTVSQAGSSVMTGTDKDCSEDVGCKLGEPKGDGGSSYWSVYCKAAGREKPHSSGGAYSENSQLELPQASISTTVIVNNV